MSSHLLGRNSYSKLTWFGIKSERQIQSPNLQNNWESLLGRYFFPLSFQNANPIKSIFIFDLMHLPEIWRLESRYFIRDGNFPLHYFFQKFPKPPLGFPSIVISASAAAILPKAWESHTQHFEFWQEVDWRHHQPEKIFIMGMPPRDGRLVLEGFKKDLRERFRNKVTVESILWRRWGDIASDAQGPFFDFETSGIQSSTLSNNDFFLQKNFRGNLFYDISTDQMISDRTTMHYVLARGGVLANISTKPTGSNLFRLSPYHGFHVYSPLRKNRLRKGRIQIPKAELQFLKRVWASRA